mgnify:CR=1 FL=1
MNLFMGVVSSRNSAILEPEEGDWSEFYED